MVFPRDREEEFHGRLISLTQEQIREVLGTLRSLSLMAENIIDGRKAAKEAEVNHKKVLESEAEAREKRRMIEDEIIRVGAILANREDFMRLVDHIDKIADLAKGIAFRILWLSKTRQKAEKGILKDLSKLSAAVLDVVTKLREALLAVTLSAETFSTKIRETEEAEDKVDEMYRKLDLKILESSMKIAPLLLTREIATMFEDVADKAEEAADTLRALSLIIL